MGTIILGTLMFIFLGLYIKEMENKKAKVKELKSELFNLQDNKQKEILKLQRENELKSNEIHNLKDLKEVQIVSLKEEYSLIIKDIQEKNKVEISEIKAEFEEKAVSKEFIETSLEKVNDLLKEKHFNLKEAIKKEEQELKELKELVELFNEEAEILEKGVYQPKYDFSNSMQYDVKLKTIREEQKRMMRMEEATNVNKTWTLDNSEKEGIKITKKYIKQILRSFNSECDVQINKVTYKNIKTTEERIHSIYSQLNNLYNMTGVEIHINYLELKIEEMYLAFEYAEQKHEEKELLKHEKYLERERKKEERILNEEIQEKKRNLNREMTHYKKILKKLNKKLDIVDSTKSSESIYNEIKEVENKIEEKKTAKEELDFRESHLSAGYVYIISNIGAFGKDVVKIGVTRRLEPLDRIKELSSASVPFTYDVHALVFSYNAFELEKELHAYFDKYRVNKVNARKEFFRVSIDEIENKLKDYGDLTIDFLRDADATEYYQSQAVGQ